jgi:hypothetical protein
MPPGVTADTPFTADLGSGGHGPYNNIQLVYRLMEFGSLEINEEVKKVVGMLSLEYINLVRGLYKQHLEMRSRDMRAVAEYLTALAITVPLTFIHLAYSFIHFPKSLFFAVIQVIFIQFTAGCPTSFSNIPAPASAALNFFSFSAIALDTVGAAFALTSARTLFKTVNKADDVREATCNATNMIWHALDAVRKNSAPGSHPVSALEKSCHACHKIFDDLGRVTYITDHKLNTHYGVLTVTSAGMIFFFVSLFIFVITTQRMVVWVPTVVLVIMTTVGLLVKELRYNPDIWKELPFTSGLAARRNRRYMAQGV